MLFLLKIRTHLPGDWSPEQRAELLDRQFATGVALMQRGVILRMFRGVGQLTNFSIWETPTHEGLQAALQSLPLFPFMVVSVTPVMKHPLEEAYERANGPMRGL